MPAYSAKLRRKKATFAWHCFLQRFSAHPKNSHKSSKTPTRKLYLNVSKSLKVSLKQHLSSWPCWKGRSGSHFIFMSGIYEVCADLRFLSFFKCSRFLQDLLHLGFFKEKPEGGLTVMRCVILCYLHEKIISTVRLLRYFRRGFQGLNRV